MRPKKFNELKKTISKTAGPARRIPFIYSCKEDTLILFNVTFMFTFYFKIFVIFTIINMFVSRTIYKTT